MVVPLVVVAPALLPAQEVRAVPGSGAQFLKHKLIGLHNKSQLGRQADSALVRLSPEAHVLNSENPLGLAFERSESQADHQHDTSCTGEGG